MNENQNQNGPTGGPPQGNPYYNGPRGQDGGPGRGGYPGHSGGPAHGGYSNGPGSYYSYGHYNARGPASWFNFKDSEYMKGFLMGAAGTYLATNDNVQKSLARYLVGIWMNVQESVEEFKEKIEDAKAEIESEKQ